MTTPRIQLEWLPGGYAIGRLHANSPWPVWASVEAKHAEHLLCITRTDRELSIVCEESLVPADLHAERSFLAMRIKGTLPMNLIGVLARLTSALADANVAVLAISTHDTDYLLVKRDDRERTIKALTAVADWSHDAE